MYKREVYFVTKKSRGLDGDEIDLFLNPQTHTWTVDWTKCLYENIEKAQKHCELRGGDVLKFYIIAENWLSDAQKEMIP